MDAHASPNSGSEIGLPAGPLAGPAAADMSLSAVLAALAGHDDSTLSLEYDGRLVQPGYHVTEVKAGSFVTLDCGANADAWQETILQVEDIPAAGGKPQMTVGKFRAILAQVDRKVRLNPDARLTFEIGRPDEPMRVFDVADVRFAQNVATLALGPRPAICKPRHRAALAQAAASSCCAPAAKSSGCC